MVLLKLFSKIVIIFPLFLWGLDTKFHITTDINLYSDKLYFDVFSHKWEELPSDKSTNRAINFSNMAIYKNYQKFSIGYRYRSEGILEINKGFIETWYYASNDFNTLTKKSDIGYFISEPDIYGILNYYQMDSIFYKRFLKNNNSILSLTFNILRGKQLQYMEVKGNNEKDRFITDIDYYYTDKNLLLKNMEDVVTTLASMQKANAENIEALNQALQGSEQIQAAASQAESNAGESKTAAGLIENTVSDMGNLIEELAVLADELQ